MAVNGPDNISLPADDLHDAAVIDALRKMICAAGLTADEAEGLVAAWTPQFFGTDGTRTLLIMDRQDYDTLCPMQIRPTPTPWARVGIVLKEFK